MSSFFPQPLGQLSRPRTPSPPRYAVESITPGLNTSDFSSPFNTSAFSSNYSCTPSFNSASSYPNGYMSKFNDTNSYPNDHTSTINDANSYHNTPAPMYPTHPHSIISNHPHSIPSNYPYPSESYQIPTMPPQTLPSHAPSPPPPQAKEKVVLILLLDHGTAWASPRHQDLIYQLKANNYDVVASSPASAALSITRYNPAIILVFEATALNKKCNRKLLTDRLRDFTHAGGILIFGGVPWAFNPVKKHKAKTVFNTAFHVDWLVDGIHQMDVGDTSARMQTSTLTLNGTYLHNVPLKSRLYRPLPHSSKGEGNLNEPCPVVLQAYGNGCMGYIGAKDLFSEKSKFMLVGMCDVAEGVAMWKGGRSPAEVMMGGKVWEPMGWRD